MEKYQLVLDLMKARGGRVEVADPELQALLGKMAPRISVFMSHIRRLAKLEVKTIRDHRKAIAFELVVANPGATDDAIKWQNSKYFGVGEEPASPATPATTS